jgi:nitrogen regulatory protein PII
MDRIGSDRGQFSVLVPVTVRRWALGVKRPIWYGGGVVQIIALIKPFRAQAVLSKLEGLDVLGGAVREVMGSGRQKDRLHRYLGSEYAASFVPKVEITLFVRDQDAPAAVRAIVGQARTGRMGDGKLLIVPCLNESVAW